VSYLLFTGACSCGVRGMDFFRREWGGGGWLASPESKFICI